MIHEVWDLDNTVYRKCIMALKCIHTRISELWSMVVENYFRLLLSVSKNVRETFINFWISLVNVNKRYLKDFMLFTLSPLYLQKETFMTHLKAQTTVFLLHVLCQGCHYCHTGENDFFFSWSFLLSPCRGPDLDFWVTQIAKVCFIVDSCLFGGYWWHIQNRIRVSSQKWPNLHIYVRW